MVFLIIEVDFSHRFDSSVIWGFFHLQLLAATNKEAERARCSRNSVGCLRSPRARSASLLVAASSCRWKKSQMTENQTDVKSPPL